MEKLEWLTPDIQLFGGEGQGAEIGETGGNIADAGQKSEPEMNDDEEFESLINGRFKDKFTKKTQAIIDKRFKTTKELEEYKAKTSPIIEGLMEKYNIPAGEEARLLEADFDTMHTEDVSEAEPPREEAVSQLIKSRVAQWIKQGEELKSKLPYFDLRQEMKEHKEFSKLLLGGVDVKTAYETVHRDRIMSDAMAYTASKVRKQVVDNIQAKGMRPVENGTSSQGAVMTAVDVNSLTSQDILKILKQVENGANVKF